MMAGHEGDTRAEGGGESGGARLPTKGEGWVWEQLDHRPDLPSAITLHRLVPKPQPPPCVRTKSSLAHYKHIKPEEMEAAQAKARRDLLIARLRSAYSTDPSTAQDPEKIAKEKKRVGLPVQPSTSRHVGHGKKKSNLSNKTSVGAKTKPRTAIRQGIGEEGLRLRQLTKLVNQIALILRDLDDLWKQESPQKDFVTPLENDIKRKRWEEFLRATGRSLFALKQEVRVLERTTRPEDRSSSSKYLRTLAVATRTLLRLIMALQTHANKVNGAATKRHVWSELIQLAHRLFPIIASMGVCTPPLYAKPDGEGENSNTSSSSSSGELSEIAMSDVDSGALASLSQTHVRSRLALLADKHCRRKRKLKKKPSSNSPRGHRAKVVKTQTNIILLPRDSQAGPKPRVDRREALPSPQLTGRQHSPNRIPDSSNSKGGESQRTVKRRPTSDPIESGDHDSDPSPGSAVVEAPTNSSEDNRNLCVGENTGNRISPDSRLRVMDGRELVENTAEAVVERLRDMFVKDSKNPKDEDSTSVEEAETKGASQLDPSLVVDITQRVTLLLHRVCKIEEEQKEADELIDKLSPRTAPQNSAHSLPYAIKRAQEAMASLSVHNQQPHIPPSKIGVSIPKVPQTFKEARIGLQSRIMFKTKDVRVDKEEEDIDEGRCGSESGVVVRSVADQVRRQKEEFWASLVERGYLKPQTLMSRESHDVLDLIHKRTSDQAQSEMGNEVIKDSHFKTDLTTHTEKTHGASHVKHKENKETQVSSSLNSSSDLGQSGQSSRPSNSSNIKNKTHTQSSLPSSNRHISTSHSEDSSETKSHTPSSHHSSKQQASTSHKEDSSKTDNNKNRTDEQKTGSDDIPTHSTSADSHSNTFPSYEGISKS